MGGRDADIGQSRGEPLQRQRAMAGGVCVGVWVCGRVCALRATCDKAGTSIASHDVSWGWTRTSAAAAVVVVVVGRQRRCFAATAGVGMARGEGGRRGATFGPGRKAHPIPMCGA